MCPPCSGALRLPAGFRKLVALLRRLNDLPIFDPSRIPGREVVARILGSLIAGAFVLHMVFQMPRFPGFIREVYFARPWFANLSFLPKGLVAAPIDWDDANSPVYTHEQIRTLWVVMALLWISETLLFLGYIAALVTRVRAKSVARGFMETVFPVLMTASPVAIMMTKTTFQEWFKGRPQEMLRALLALYAVLLAAGIVNLVGLLTLRRAFAIMSEAREFVRSGIYRYVRHPLYAAHFAIVLCFTILHFRAATAAIYVALVAGQTLRARIEERKLAAAFPEYEEYRRTTGMFFPRLWKSAKSA